MFTEHAITLNIVPGDVPPVAHVSQYDVGREIRITLLDGSKGFELSPDYSYTLVGTKSSGKGFSYDDILEITNNALVFKTTGQMTVVDGPVVCGIIIMDGDEHVETLSFILEVHQSALTTDTIIDSDDFHSIIQDEVRAYLERTGILIDRYLRVQGAAADAKATGDALALKVNNPVSNPNGESGQFLRTNGDGTTTWANAAVPTDSQLSEAVQDWLDNHPDATLNIEDGSIMPVKLSDGINALLDEVNNLDENYAAVDFENVDTAWVSTGFARRLLTDQGLIADEDTARGTVRNGYLTGINVVGDSITAGTIDGNNVQMVNIPASQIVGNITRNQIANGSIDLSALTSGVTDEIDSALATAGLARQEIAATNENLSSFESSVASSISDLQDQIDGSIETWFYSGEPSSSTEPEVNWTTTDDKNQHLGDLYYDSETGYCYRYQLNNGAYEWHLIADSDISTALAAAAAAQDTADSKRRVFYTTPTPPYDQGDLWVQGSGGDILRCQTAKAAGGVFAQSDWVLASKYTDDTVASQAYSIANGKSTAYYQATEPTGGTYTTNDIWFDTDNDNKMYSWNGTQWVERLLDTNALDDGAITAEKIYAGAVTTGKISAGAVTTNELAAEAVTAAKIKAGEITANEIASNTILGSNIAGNTITGTNILAGTITTREIDANVLKVSNMSDAGSVVTGTTVKTQYYLSTSNQSATGGSWGDTIPSWSSGKYVWTRVATTKSFADGTSNTTYSTAICDNNLTTALSTANSASTAAQNAQNTANSAAGSVSVKTQFYLSTSSTALSGGSWSDSVPTWASGKYIWTRTATTVTPVSGTATTSYTPSANGAYDSNLTTALMNAATAQSTANGANYREQTIYISKASGTTSVSANTTWVTVATDSQNTWTTKRPTYNSSYPVLFVATQRQTVAQSSGTTCSCTTPVKDDTTTVIDGGHITTGTIDANNVTISNLTVAALTNDAQQQVLNSVAISTANSYTDSAVDSIEIGGRNLFIAATRSNDIYITNAGATGNWRKTVTSDYIAVSAGDSMIAQFWKPENTAATGDDRGYFSVAYWNSSKAFISRTYQYFTSDYLSYQFEVPINAAYIRVTYHFGIDGPLGTDWDPYGTFQVKVEKGNMPTDWSIAPEDIDSGLTTVQSSITQTANEIRTSVSQTYETKTDAASKLTTAKNYADSAVDSIDIGGRNIIRDSLPSNDNSLWAFAGNITVATEDGYPCLKVVGAANSDKHANPTYTMLNGTLTDKHSILPYANLTIIMSADVKMVNVVKGTTNYFLGFYGSGQTINGTWRAPTLQNDGKHFTNNTTSRDLDPAKLNGAGWTRVWCKFTYGDYAWTGLQPNIYARDFTGTVYFKNIKVEIGNIVTEWTPAPEDIDSELTTMQSSITQNANNIALKVSQTDYNGNTIASLINQNATTVQIAASKINLTGQVTINDLDSSVQTSISNGSSAYSRATALRGTCSTAATTAAKVVTCAGFALTQGATVTVYFSTANTKADAALTLNVNSTGAKTIYVASAATSATNQLLWVAGSSLTFVYDGTYWRVLDSPGTWDGTACAVAAGTAAKTTTASGVVIFKGTTISVPMTYANTSTSATLNVSSLGAKNIYYGTTTTRPTTSNGRGWIAGRTVDFRFDGAYWRLKDTGTVIDGSHITTGTIDVDRLNLYSEMTVNQAKGGAVGGTLGYMSGLTTDDSGQNPTTTHGMGLKSSDADHYIIVTTDGIRLTEKVSDTQTNDVYLANGNFVVKANAIFKSNAYVKNTLFDTAQNNTTIRPWVIWENASPTSAFSAQTIPPSSPSGTWTQDDIDAMTANIKKFSFFYVEIRFTTSDASKDGALLYVPSGSSAIARPTALYHYNNYIDDAYRNVTINRSAGSITFSTGYSAGSNFTLSSSTTYAIPTLILGFNPQNRS